MTQIRHNITNKYLRSNTRSGFTVWELSVTATVLISVMSLVGTLSLKVKHVWRDIRHHRIAVCEMSNQLDELTRLPKERLSERIQNLLLSDECKISLDQPEIEGKIVDDPLGQQIVLSMRWKKTTPMKPVVLSAWHQVPLNQSETPQSEPNENDLPPSPIPVKTAANKSDTSSQSGGDEK